MTNLSKTRDRFNNPLKIGDWVSVVKQGTLNCQIDMVGYIGIIEEIGENDTGGVAQVNCANNGCGAIETNCLKKVGEPSTEIKYLKGFLS